MEFYMYFSGMTIGVILGFVAGYVYGSRAGRKK